MTSLHWTPRVPHCTWTDWPTFFAAALAGVFASVAAGERILSVGALRETNSGRLRANAGVVAQAAPPIMPSMAFTLEDIDRAHQGVSLATRLALDAHARGETDYYEFSRQLADAGVAAWVMDTIAMTCAFCAKSGTALIVEPV